MDQAVAVRNRKVRYAVVGIGWISQTAFLPGVEHTGNSEAVAFVSGHQDKAERVGEKYGIHTFYSYDEYDKLLSSGTIDAVYLATPNWDHVDLAVRTLNAGIHLLLEKPMATSVADCERTIAASEHSHAKLMIAYRLHHDAGTLKAFEIARSGQLGYLRYFNSSFSQPVNYQNHRAKNGYWAGPVPDMGPYPINTVRNLFNAEPLEVLAMGTRTEPERFRDFDDQVAINLRFPGDRLATMLLSYSGADLDDFRIVGTLGDLYSSPAFSVGAAIRHTVTMGESKKKFEDSFRRTDQFGGELRYFSDCILYNRDPEADGEEGLLDVRVFEAIERSLQTGRSQKLEPYTRRRHPARRQVEDLRATHKPDLVGAHAPSQGR
jgi:predicted dehydrogenase